MMAIPRRIIQSHESQCTLSATFAACQDRLLELHYDYDYQFFSAWKRREFIRERRPELLDLYDFYPLNIQRSDLFRVIAIFELGGFYFDLDVHFHEALNGLCGSTLVLAEEWKMSADEYERRHSMPLVDERDLVQVGNYGFAACARHWFFKEVIDEMLHRAAAVNPSSVTNGDVFFSTGPDVLSSVYARVRDQLAGAVTILDGSEHGRWCQFGRYGTHLMAGSWS